MFLVGANTVSGFIKTQSKRAPAKRAPFCIRYDIPLPCGQEDEANSSCYIRNVIEHALIVHSEIKLITLDAIASVRSDTPKLRRTSVVTLEGEYQSTLALSIKYCVKGYQFDNPKICLKKKHPVPRM